MISRIQNQPQSVQLLVGVERRKQAGFLFFGLNPNVSVLIDVTEYTRPRGEEIKIDY
nr:hypothetical protein Q903MT_gene271 [Picea sitchensis]